MLKKLVLILTLLLCSVILSVPSQARPIKGRVALTTRSLNFQESQLYDFRLGKEINNLVSNSVDSNLYDPYTLAELRATKELAEPRTNSDDIDPEKTRYVVEKALAIQTANTIIPIIQRSDMREALSLIKDSIQGVTDLFRYSVQQSGSGYTVSRKSHGKKLIELDLHISPKQGLDPQIRIGESVRFRYDWLSHQTMLEYGVNF